MAHPTRLVSAGRRALVRDGPSFARYLLVGCVNSCVGFGLIFVLLWAGTNPYVANVSGYAVGITVSYVLNKRFSFRSSRPNRRAFPLFAATLGVAYLSNLLALFLMLRFVPVDPYLAQLLAGAVYTFVGFLGSRYVAFRENPVAAY